MNYRTDLTIELAEDSGECDGISSDVSVINGVTVTRTVIHDGRASELIGKPQGKYYTLEMLPFSDAAFEPDECFETAADIIRELLPEQGCVLTAGLGNSSRTHSPDMRYRHFPWFGSGKRPSVHRRFFPRNQGDFNGSADSRGASFRRRRLRRKRHDDNPS